MKLSKLKVVYIAGMSRSGSTILQMFMATHPEMVSVGESLHAIRLERADKPLPEASWPCSCGHRREDCELWGPLVEHLSRGSLSEPFELLITRFQSLFPGKNLIDASKQLIGLEDLYLPLAARGDIELKVVHLVRDVRGWAVSAVTRRKELGEFAFYIIETHRWAWSTWKRMRFFKKKRIPTLTLLHDDFACDVEGHAALLARFLQVENNFSEERLNRAQAHELYGSPRIKFDSQWRSRIRYDSRWLGDWRPFVYTPFTIVPLVFNFMLRRFIARSCAQIS